MDLVSVITPAYNRSHFIGELIASVTDQTHRPIEFILVDDGSTDDTEEVVRAETKNVKSEDVRVRYFKQPNQGAPSARNKGIEVSEGDFIQFLDSDDILHPQKLGLQVSALQEHSEADVAKGGYQFFQDGEPPSHPRYPREEVLRSATIQPIRHPGEAGHPETFLYRRAAIRKIGNWNESLERWQDWEYCFRVAAHNLSSISLPGTYYFLREHDTGKIGDLEHSSDAARICLNTLRAIDDIVARLDSPNPAFHNAAFRLYLNVLKKALRTGQEEEILSCLRGARSHSRSWKRKAKVDLLRALHGIFGRTAALRFQNTYSRMLT